MAMVFWQAFLVVCGTCGHRNRPHKSPREGIRMALLNELPCCRGCGKQLRLPNPRETPLVRKVRGQLIREGLLPQPQYEPLPAA